MRTIHKIEYEKLKHTPRVLIVEDESIIAQDLSKLLNKFGYDVCGILSSGEEVLEKYFRLEPDLILMDIKLKGNISGIETADEIRKNNDIPIIYVTAYTDVDSLQKAKLTEPFAYIVKPFDEKSLHTAIEITIYKHQISKKLKQRTIELEEEKKKSDLLIHNIFPKQIVSQLRETGAIKSRKFKNVSLLFTDFQGFSLLVSKMKASKVVDELNEIFSRFDDIVDLFGLEKLKTIGDSYMAGAGFPEECDDHAFRAVKAALQMQNFVCKRNLDSKYKWSMRIGIHSGKVVAGVIGKNKFTYDVWGDTVNIAHKMETKGQPNKINISASTYNLVKNHYHCDYNNSIRISLRKKMDMFFVTSEK